MNALKNLTCCFLQLIIALAGFSMPADALEVKPEWKIIVSQQESQSEKYAAEELASYLRRVTGFSLPIVNKAPSGTGEIVVRYDPQLEGEEWRLHAGGNQIWITGGRPRGVLYGVYDFLERHAGCRFLDMYTEVVPQQKVIFPEGQDIRRKPAFMSREIYYLTGNAPNGFLKFQPKLRLNVRPWLHPELGWGERCGSPGAGHTYLKYTKDFPKEIGWMDAAKERVQVEKTTGGQLCYSHPDVRRKVAEKLRTYIEADRKAAAKAGRPYPRIYNLSANDCSVFCHCPECRKLAEKYGASGMVLDFTNAVAASIEKDYPEVILEVFAYKEAVNPPRSGMKAHPNVMVQIADWGFDWLRPLEQSPQYIALLDQWKKTANHLSIWGYWRLYFEPFPSPKTMVSSLQGYLQYYRKIGVKKIFIEAEVDELYPDSFIDLRTWLGAKLMTTPEMDVPSAIAEFMRGFYGAAAEPMTRYLNCLEERMKEEKRPLSKAFVPTRKFLDKRFFEETGAMLDEAEKAIADDPRRLLNVQQERLVIDIACLNIFKPHDPAVLKRMQENLDRFGEKYFVPSHWKKIRRNTHDYYLAQLNRPELPADLKDKAVIDFSWPDFQQRFLVIDPDAPTGKAHTTPASHYGGREPMHGREPAFGIYDLTARKGIAGRKISRQEIPRDEKYHRYFLGRVKIPEKSRFWAHWSWIVGTRLHRAYDPDHPDTEYDVYVSMKLQGPAYVPGSKQPDDLRVERIFLVRADDPSRKKPGPKTILAHP